MTKCFYLEKVWYIETYFATTNLSSHFKFYNNKILSLENDTTGFSLLFIPTTISSFNDECHSKT